MPTTTTAEDLSRMKCASQTQPNKLGRAILAAVKDGETVVTVVGAGAVRQAILSYMNALRFSHLHVPGRHIVARPFFDEIEEGGEDLEGKTCLRLRIGTVPQSQVVKRLEAEYRDDVPVEHNTEAEKLASFMVMSMSDESGLLPCRIQTVAAGALNQAIKATARARERLGKLRELGATNYDLAIVMAYTTIVDIKGRQRPRFSTVILPLVFGDD